MHRYRLHVTVDIDGSGVDRLIIGEEHTTRDEHVHEGGGDYCNTCGARL
jgi:hypothetical protein